MTTLIIDFVGTLLDSYGIYNTLMLERSETPVIANHTASMPEIVAQAQQISLVALRRQLSRLIKEKPLAFSPFADFISVLRILKRADFRLVLLAPRLKPSAQALCAEFNFDFFEFIAADTGMLSKHINLSKLFAKHEIKTPSVFYLSGDCKNLALAGQQQCRTIACPWGFSHPHDLQNTLPTYIINTPNELLTVITEQLVAS